MVEYEWFSYELIQYVSSDCIVLYLYAHIDYKDTWFSHELTQYVSLDFPFGKLKWFNVNLQISLCSKFFMALNTMISDFLMDWFNMSIQMSLLFSFIFTEITSVLDIFMDCFIMSLQNSLCCSFIHTDYMDILNFCLYCTVVFRCPCFTIMSKKNSKSTSTLPSLRGDMVHQIRPGNQSAFAFMTINNSTTPTSCSTPYFSPYNHHYCANTNFEYFCYKFDKVFMETIQPELNVRKISIKYI